MLTNDHKIYEYLLGMQKYFRLILMHDKSDNNIFFLF